MTRYLMPRGLDHLTVDIPDAIRCDLIDLPCTEAIVNPNLCVQAALKQPIGSPDLAQMVKPSDRIAIIVDDITRETPASIILPSVLKILAQSGITPDRIAIVIALGTHRPMTSDEIDNKIGPEVARKYRIVNTPAWQQEDMIYLGRSSRGIPVWLNRTVAEADLRIGIGMIMPHLDAGYGGGAKILLPGVCGQATVDAFHAQMAAITANQLGIADAVLRLDLEQCVDQWARLHFIVNAVLDSRGDLYRCVAGDAVAAHRTGVRFAREVYGVPTLRQYPLVIADAYPHLVDLWQSTKALASGERLTMLGGQLILVADCPEGRGPHPRFADYIGMDLNDLRQQLHDGAATDPSAAAEAVAICRIKQHIRIGMVTNGLSSQDVERMGFDYYATVESAIDRADLMGKNDMVLLAHGGVILPLMPSGLAER